MTTAPGAVLSEAAKSIATDEASVPRKAGAALAVAPYCDTCQDYASHGWEGTLPVPPVSKGPVPPGWTGAAAPYPSNADRAAWSETHGHWNIVLRLSDLVIGIDEDVYGTKRGDLTIADREAVWVPLPPTWRSSARTDPRSGIRFYGVPERMHWASIVGPAVEIIQRRHRYAVVWPSRHPNGSIYRWYRPDGSVSDTIPRVDELPALPDAWVAGLTGGRLADDGDTATSTALVSDAALRTWIESHGGQPCDEVTLTLAMWAGRL